MLPGLKGNADGERLLSTLDLFSYGTHADYCASPGKYIPLTDSQAFKLRQLTVITLIQNACLHKRSYLSYEDVQQSLPMGDKRAVEDVLISCIYARVVAGQLCQKTGRLLLNSRNGPPCRTRDVSPEQGVAAMFERANALQLKILQISQELEQGKAAVKAKSESHHNFAMNSRDWLSKAQVAAKGIVSGKASGWGDSSSAAAALAAAALATGQGPMDFSGARGGARRTKRSRGGLSGQADSGFGRYQF